LDSLALPLSHQENNASRFSRPNKQMSVPYDTKCSKARTSLVTNATLVSVTSCWTSPSSSVLSSQQLDAFPLGLHYFPLRYKGQGFGQTPKTASIHELPRRGLLGNPYSADRILIQSDRPEAPFLSPLSTVVNTTCSGVG
jgi:hypothetical protein